MQQDIENLSIEAYRAAIDVLMCHAGFSFHEACQELNVHADSLLGADEWLPSKASQDIVE